jgi:hypothetical protein
MAISTFGLNSFSLFLFSNTCLFCSLLQLEELVLPYLTILSEFRDNIRTEARLIKSTEILNQCDRLRDEVLPNVGVRLEDIEGK